MGQGSQKALEAKFM